MLALDAALLKWRKGDGDQVPVADNFSKGVFFPVQVAATRRWIRSLCRRVLRVELGVALSL